MDVICLYALFDGPAEGEACGDAGQQHGPAEEDQGRRRPELRNLEASLPPLVIATAAPVGSHLATEGNAGCRMPTSITNTQMMPPMMAPTVLRVSAPSATPSSP